MKRVQIILLSFLFIGFSSCADNDMEDEMQEEETLNVTKNTISSADNQATLKYFTFVKGDLQTGTVYSIQAFENEIKATNTSLGNSVLFYFKEVPTASTTLTHHGGFDVSQGQFFLNNVELNGKKWYSPYVGTKPTGELIVTIANGLATFTVKDIELSDNYVAPITATKKFSFSVSVATSYFDSDNTGFVELSN